MEQCQKGSDPGAIEEFYRKLFGYQLQPPDQSRLPVCDPWQPSYWDRWELWEWEYPASGQYTCDHNSPLPILFCCPIVGIRFPDKPCLAPTPK